MKLNISEVFLKDSFSVGANGLGAESHGQSREVWMYWEMDIAGFGLFVAFVDRKKYLE